MSKKVYGQALLFPSELFIGLRVPPPDFELELYINKRTMIVLVSMRTHRNTHITFVSGRPPHMVKRVIAIELVLCFRGQVIF